MKKRLKKASLVEESYLTRWLVIRTMGFKTYEEYLASDLWKRIRTKVLAAGKRCRKCHRRAVAVHHLSYRRNVMKGKDPTQLVPICKDCHTTLEFDGDRKRSVVEMQEFCRGFFPDLPPKPCVGLESSPPPNKISQSSVDVPYHPIICDGCGNHLKKNGKPCKVCARPSRRKAKG